MVIIVILIVAGKWNDIIKNTNLKFIFKIEVRILHILKTFFVHPCVAFVLRGFTKKFVIN